MTRPTFVSSISLGIKPYLYSKRTVSFYSSLIVLVVVGGVLWKGGGLVAESKGGLSIFAVVFVLLVVLSGQEMENRESYPG